MQRRFWTFLFLALFLIAAAAAGLGPLKEGRQLTRAFYDGDIPAVRNAFNESMKQAKTRAQLQAFQQQVARGLGRETRILGERVTEQGGLTVYERKVRYENAGQAFAVRWAFDDQGRVAGFVIRPSDPVEAASTAYADYRTQADLQLPFEGRWNVFWGGRTTEQNYHAADRGQRFAYDFLVVRDGRSHSGTGTKNADYHCWRRSILAPADGRIVAVRDGLPDNNPGVMDPDHPLGNHVVIDHGGEEYSFLAHLGNGSVAVEKGETVVAGQRVGLCGNSGNSSEPHLHYHLQNTPEFGAGEGLPAQFQGYVADGEPVERGEPVKGQIVAPAG